METIKIESGRKVLVRGTVKCSGSITTMDIPTKNTGISLLECYTSEEIKAISFDMEVTGNMEVIGNLLVDKDALLIAKEIIACC